MFARFTFLIVMFLGLAAGQARGLGTCMSGMGEPVCQSCCADVEMACCVQSSLPQTPGAPAKVAPASEAKQIFPPAPAFLSFAPPPAVAPRPVHRRHAARIPVQHLIEKTCIRLV